MEVIEDGRANSNDASPNHVGNGRDTASFYVMSDRDAHVTKTRQNHSTSLICCIS